MLPWALFVLFVLVLLALDLGVFHRRSRVLGVREALLWTGFWVFLALLFDVGVYFAYDRHWLGIGESAASEPSAGRAALQFLTGFLVEKSLSADNIFVIAFIFTHFRTPAAYQHRILFWGILGALVMRGAMIAAGAALLQRFDWIAYVFGAFLIFTAVRLLVIRHETLEPEKNLLYRVARRLFTVSPTLDGDKFFTRVGGKLAVTPLFLVLLLVESSDVIFAVDSIPAIFAITSDPFLVFTSNVFAILGLRSLYFALAGLMEKFRYLKISLVVILAYVGIKMLLAHQVPIPAVLSLAVILGILLAGVLASVRAARRDPAPPASPLDVDERR